MTKEQKKDSFWFDLTEEDQYITIKDLMDQSGDKITYYILLISSSVIIAAGILLANSAILIGGMLITPLLTPVLLVSLGITTSNYLLVKKSIIKIGKSVGFVVGVSFLVALIFNLPTQEDGFFNSALFNNSFASAFLYFLVAFTSGIVATYAWVRKQIDNMLPGIAIAVSLVPPIAMVGTFIGLGNIDYARYYLLVFLFNIVGIIGGSMILFSMFKFYKSSKVIEKKLDRIERAEKENQIKKALETMTVFDSDSGRKIEDIEL